MNKTVLTIIMTALLMPAAAVAAHGDHGGKHGKRMDHLATELQLTDEQRERFQSVMQEQREKGKALRTETQTRIDAILTDEQRGKLETLRAERKQKWMERRQQYKDRQSSRQ